MERGIIMEESPPPSIDTAPIPKGMVSVTPHVLNPKQVAAIRADAKALYSSGAFVPDGCLIRAIIDCIAGRSPGQPTSQSLSECVVVILHNHLLLFGYRFLLFMSIRILLLIFAPRSFGG